MGKKKHRGDSGFARELERWVRWLVLFQSLNLTRLGDADWKKLKLQTDLEGLATRFIGFGRIWPSDVLTGDSHIRVIEGWGAAPSRRPPPLTRTEVAAFHDKLREICDSLFPRDEAAAEVEWLAQPDRRVVIPATIRQVRLSASPVFSADGPARRHSQKKVVRLYGADWPDWLWLSIAAAFEEFGPRIVRCAAPDCDRLFLRNRRQAFCSGRCSQRVRSKEWYERHRERAQEQRRQAYRRKRQETSYRNIRVSTRPRRTTS
jgi:hypothetical protein